MGTMWDAAVAGYNGGAAREPLAGTARATETETSSTWDKLFATKFGETSTPTPYSGKPDDNFVVRGLVQRGLPQHVAEGFAMNMKDESGFDPGINERNPIVKGSRGGYGLYQLTGPRRRQYEKFAASKGVDVADPNAQLDFLVWELGNTEKTAADAIMNTSSAGEAGAVIVNKFLRPAESHRKRRASKYLSEGGSTSYQAPSPTKLWLDF